MFSAMRYLFAPPDEPTVRDAPVKHHNPTPPASKRTYELGESSQPYDTERRIAMLEAEVSTMQETLQSVSAQLAQLEEAGLTAPESQEGKVKMILQRQVPHYRKDHPTKDELLLAARWSQLTYVTAPEGDPGITASGWNALRHKDADGIKGGIWHMFEDAPWAPAYKATIERIEETAMFYPDMEMIAHLESGGHYDGQVSIWRSDNRRVLMVAWRGTDSKEDAQLDAQSVLKVPWHNREEVAAKHGTLVGVAGAKGPDRHLQRGEANDPSVSPLPHYGLLKRTLMVGKGFLTQYLGEQLSARVKRVVAEQLKSKAVGYEVLICGHSLGGAVATLCAYELACQYLKTSILLVTFGSPRTVNTEFANVLSRLPNLRCYRVANEYDVVSRVPPYFLDFQHVGKFIWIRWGNVRPPRRFGHQPWVLLVGHFMWCCGTTGVADHSMELYLDRLAGGGAATSRAYSWSRYMRLLERLRDNDHVHEHEGPVRAITNRVARLLRGEEAEKHMSNLARSAMSARVSRKSAVPGFRIRQTNASAASITSAAETSLTLSESERSVGGAARPSSVGAPVGATAMIAEESVPPTVLQACSSSSANLRI